LHPETPEAGRSLVDLFAGQDVDIDAMLAYLTQTAAKLGLAFGDRRMTYNSRRAQELGKWAADQGRESAYHHAVFVAYFVDGRNIAHADVLLKIIASLGLDCDRAAQVIDERPYRAAVDADWQRCRQLGIRAAPTFRIKDQARVGAQPYAALSALLGQAGVPGRS